MYLFLTILVLIASFLMILIVLVQNSKGGGLASGFSSNNQYMGVRKTTDFLEKSTWVLAGCICLLSMASAAFVPRATTARNSESEIRKQVEDAASTNTMIPNFGEMGESAPDGEEPVQE